jgi:hypothetical protein
MELELPIAVRQALKYPKVYFMLLKSGMECNNFTLPLIF